MKFIDALYGEIDLDLKPEIISLPELQRLREVRLCNVNSPYITGGASLNRFEHAIGTAYLAQQFALKNKIEKSEKELFIIGSLLHDIVTPPFGHSLEYLFDALEKNVYEHAHLDTLFKGKTIQYSRPYFMNKKSILFHKIDFIETKKIHELYKSKHYLSKYLIGDIDIDNIDNVFRFAYHVGIKFNAQTPLHLAEILKYKDNKLVITDNGHAALYNEWFIIRKRLYKYLLENHGDFVAKALLERVFIELIKDDVINEYDWILVDFGFVLKAINSKNAIAKTCIQRYMSMDFPKYQGIYQTHSCKKMDSILSSDKIEIIERSFKKEVFLHFIRDVNKTQRVLNLFLINEDEKFLKNIRIGEPNDRYLIGFFSDNPKAIPDAIKLIENSFEIELNELNGDKKKSQEQLSLF